MYLCSSCSYVSLCMSLSALLCLSLPTQFFYCFIYLFCLCHDCCLLENYVFMLHIHYVALYLSVYLLLMFLLTLSFTLSISSCICSFLAILACFFLHTGLAVFSSAGQPFQAPCCVSSAWCPQSPLLVCLLCRTLFARPLKNPRGPAFSHPERNPRAMR